MLKKVSNQVEVLTIDGTEIHAVRPSKSKWDEYVDDLFVRDKDGELQTKSARGIKTLYRACVKKIVNVEVERNGTVASGVTLVDPDEIVDFLTGITDLKAGREIDAWLLGLGELTKEETKN